jgi:hypothetical protein
MNIVLLSPMNCTLYFRGRDEYCIIITYILYIVLLLPIYCTSDTILLLKEIVHARR